jgi:hypothetical protein
MKKYTIKYINIKHDDFWYPVSSDGYGGSYYFTTNLDKAYKCSCQKGCAKHIGRSFAIRIFHDLYCPKGGCGEFIPSLPEHMGDTWEIIELEEGPDSFELQCLETFDLNKSYLESIKRHTQEQLGKLLKRKPYKIYTY